MSDNTAVGNDAGEQEDIVSTQEVDTSAAPSLDDLVDDAATAEKPSEEDWRSSDSGGDEKILRELKRYANRQNVAKALIDAKARIRAGLTPTVPTLPENATEEQVAAYRKALGVPETADGYGLKFDDALKPGDAEAAMLKGLQEHALAQNVPLSHLNAVFNWYQGELTRQNEERTSTLEQAHARQRADLRREYGAEVSRNLKITEEFLEEQGIGAILDATLPNGMPLKFDPMLKKLVQMAREFSSSDALFEGDGASGGKSLDEQIAEFTQKSITGKLTAAEDKRYMDALAARDRRDSRRNRAA